MYFVVLLKNLTVGAVSELLSVLVKFPYILCLANDFGHILSQSRGQGRCGQILSIAAVICLMGYCCWRHRVQRSLVWINELLILSLTLKNVYTCRLAWLISPVGSLWIYCKRFLRFLSDRDRLCCSPFWKSITASHILAGARHVARRVTEAQSANLASPHGLLVCGI